MQHPVKCVVLGAVGALLVTAAHADFPERPITLIVPSPAGGSTDVGARFLAEAIEPILGQTVLIENRPGGATLVGMQALATSAADGYTLGYTIQPFLAVNVYVREAPFTVDDFEPVALQVDDPNTIAVHVDAPWETFEDLIEDMRERPGQISWGDTGYLSDDHLVTVAVERELGVEANPVHYEGSAPLTAAVLGGHVDVYVGNIGDTKVPYEDGNFRVLAVATEERTPDLPDTPTLRELGIDLVASSARGISAPAGTPPEHADILADAIEQASKDPEYLRRMEDQGLSSRVITRDEYGQFLRDRMDFVRGILEELGEL